MKTRFFSLFVALIATASVFADDFQSGDLYYNITSDNTAAVTYPSNSSYYYLGLTSAVIPESVTYDGTTYRVTSIEDYTFEGCSGLTSVTIPNSVTSIGNHAFDGCSGLTSITIPNSVTSIGNETFRGCSGLTSITIPNSVTSIGDGAFYYCTGLASVTIPNSVTSIGYNAFSDCSGLTSVIWNAKSCKDFSSSYDAPFSNSRSQITSFTFGDEVEHIPAYLCQGMAGLTSITIPNSVTSIGEYAFSDCSGLTSVTIPNSVTSIGEYAFSDCSGLTSVAIPNSVTSIGESAFSNILNIVYSGTATGASWGARCMNGYIEGYLVYSDATKKTLVACNSAATRDITIPNSVTSIGDSAFYGCSGLTSVTIPNSVTSIGNHAFSGCSGLTSVTIPNSITSIEDYTFEGCSGLTSVTIPNSVTSIGWGAFRYCTGLTSVTIPNSVTYIGSDAFYETPWLDGQQNGVIYIGNILYKYKGEMPQGTKIIVKEGTICICGSAFEYCEGLTSVTIPNSVTSIEWGAFQYCTGLTSVTIPNSVTSIGDAAFNCCINLTSITIPNSVTSIGEWVFRECYSLTSITIPSSVTSIGERAFQDCSGLTSVTIPNSVTSIGKEAFFRCSSLTSITIPNSVISIGSAAFYFVPNIAYSGTATGAPWGARSINGYVEGYLVYSDATKKTLLACSSAATGAISIPYSVTSIGEEAFSECYSLTSVTIPNSVTSIGEYAFYDVPNIAYFGTATGAPWGARSINGYVEGYLVYSDATKKTLLACSSAAKGNITIPNSVTSIGEEAFYDCEELTSVTCYAIEPPQIYYNSFGYDIDSIPLYVPIGSVEKYKVAEYWRNYFKEILPISAMPADVDEPVIDPESTTVTITWPATDEAATYTIEISKDGALVCTLTFDANGVLKNMRFAAPARHAAQHTTQAETTGSGFRFVVEGLDYATTYSYTITAKDTEDKVVESYNGTFTTTAPTSTEDVHSTPSQPAVRKVFRNGQVLILRGGKTYTLTGDEL